MKKVTLGTWGIAAAAVAIAAVSASAGITETVYGTTGTGGIDFNDPLYSFTLPGSLFLSSQTETLVSYGDSSFGNWGLPGGQPFGVDFTGNIFAPAPGYYSFNLSADGTEISLTGTPGIGGVFDTGTANEFNVYLSGGDNTLDLQYLNNGQGHASADVTVNGFDPGVDSGVPDTVGIAGLFPAALCAAHALRGRFRKA